MTVQELIHHLQEFSTNQEQSAEIFTQDNYSEAKAVNSIACTRRISDKDDKVIVYLRTFK